MARLDTKFRLFGVVVDTQFTLKIVAVLVSAVGSLLSSLVLGGGSGTAVVA